MTRRRRRGFHGAAPALQRHVERQPLQRPRADGDDLVGALHDCRLLVGGDPHPAPSLQLPGLALIEVDPLARLVVLAVLATGHVHVAADELLRSRRWSAGERGHGSSPGAIRRRAYANLTWT